MNRSKSPIIPLKAFSRYEPKKKDGQLYYVRLKTPYGLLYKLGYTSLGSVYERMSYNGTGDEELIDRVFLFQYFDNAFDMEETLHDHFSVHSIFGRYTDLDMPLLGNGQSELYVEDILGMDEEYTFEQYKKTRGAILLHQIMRQGKSREEANTIIKREIEVWGTINSLEKPFLTFLKMYERLTNIFASPNSKREYLERQERALRAKNMIRDIKELHHTSK